MKKSFLTMLLLLIVMVGGAAELWWAPVPGATGYTVYYSCWSDEPHCPGGGLHVYARTSDCHVVLNCPEDVFLYVRAWNDNDSGASKLSKSVYFPPLTAPTNVVIK